VTDGTIFAGSVDALKYQKQGVAIGCVVQALHRTQIIDVLVEEVFVLVF
jgi:hypothetical protein